jgi:hypothetical protein
MTNNSAQDSDSDYGYDLSAEDEAILFQIADSTSNSTSRAASAIATELASVATSEECGHLNDAALDLGFVHAHEPCLLMGEPKALFSCGKTPSLGDGSKPRTLPTRLSREDDASYPDCTYFVTIQVRAVSAQLTDCEATSEPSFVYAGIRGHEGNVHRSS